MTWHYIFVKPNPRLLKYQLLTAHTHVATVEDQPEYHRNIRMTNQQASLQGQVLASLSE